MVRVTAHGRGVASHARSRLLADLAEVTGLFHAFREALSGLRQRAVRGMIRVRVLVDLAVMLSDGGEAISDLAVLRDQPDLFGPVASTAKPCRGLGQHRRDRLGSVAPSACGGSGALQPSAPLIRRSLHVLRDGVVEVRLSQQYCPAMAVVPLPPGRTAYR
ncbi:hypothetical protein GCM10010530_80190 [Kribbella aluminosa]